MIIGVISDTHNFLDPSIPELFKNVDHILHAGDVGLPWVLQALEEIAPVTAVGGNTDDPRFGYSLTRVVVLDQIKFLLHHIVTPGALCGAFQDRVSSEMPAAVVFGHTHKPHCEYIKNVLFFNPGYAGKQRFALPRSAALLHCNAGQIIPQMLPL